MGFICDDCCDVFCTVSSITDISFVIFSHIRMSYPSFTCILTPSSIHLHFRFYVLLLTLISKNTYSFLVSYFTLLVLLLISYFHLTSPLCSNSFIFASFSLFSDFKQLRSHIDAVSRRAWNTLRACLSVAFFFYGVRQPAITRITAVQQLEFQ